MKYIKSYELHKTDIEEDDYIVAYRPYKDSDVTAPITHSVIIVGGYIILI